MLFVLVGVLRRINSILVIQRRQFTNPYILGYFQPVLNQSIIPTLAGRSKCYSHNPERQGGKPLLPVLETLVCRGRGSNLRPPAHEADALTTWPLRRLLSIMDLWDELNPIFLERRSYILLERSDDLSNSREFNFFPNDKF